MKKFKEIKEAGDMGDYLGMDKKQKMKFDQLMKKLDGGKEHMKFRRMAKTPVQGDDMFHGYVKDLATGAIKEATGVRQFGPIVLSKERKAKLVKVYDTLEVGDVVSIKFKRGGYQKQIPIRKKEVLRNRNRGWTRITFGDGVYLYKDPEEGRVVYAHGRMPSEVMDMIKESVGLEETVQINEVQQKNEKFSDAQLQKMKKAYSTLKRIDPSSANYKKLKTKIRGLDVDRLEQLARAKIRFVSTIAAGEYAIKSGKRLHARDYLESTELEESVKISFHSKGAKTKWMKKQAVASKEILNQTPTSVELPSRWKDLSKKKDHDEIFSVSISESLEEKAITLGGTNKTGGEIFMGDKGIQKMIALSKKNPNIEYTVKSDNYGDFKAHWLKNGKFARRTVANINFDMDKNAVRGVPKGKSVKSTIFVLRYSVNEGVKVVAERKLTDAEMDKREKVAKAIEKDNPDMPMGKKMAIATNVAKGVQMENDEYDNEGGMALQQLKVAKDAAMELCDIIKKDDNLPEWVQSKLTKAVDYMDSVRDYMSSKDADEYVDESSDLAKMQSADNLARKKSKEMNTKLNRASDNKQRAIYRLSKQKQTATMGSGIKKDSPEMKKLDKTYVNKVNKIIKSENVDESMARARADARRHMGGRGAQRGMAPLKKDSDISASDADRKAANKNIIMQIRKAADLPNGAEVEFPSGKKKLDRNTAQQLLTKFGSLRRSSEKDTFQKSIKSLADVKKILGR